MINDEKELEEFKKKLFAIGKSKGMSKAETIYSYTCFLRDTGRL